MQMESKQNKLKYFDSGQINLKQNTELSFSDKKPKHLDSFDFAETMFSVKESFQYKIFY